MSNGGQLNCRPAWEGEGRGWAWEGKGVVTVKITKDHTYVITVGSPPPFDLSLMYHTFLYFSKKSRILMFFALIRMRNKILIKMVCNFLKIAQELGEIILYFFFERKKN